MPTLTVGYLEVVHPVPQVIGLCNADSSEGVRRKVLVESQALTPLHRLSRERIREVHRRNNVIAETPSEQAEV